jgi:anaphase-promoting complex subunit 6
MEALALDVKCYDAFEQLVSSEMMTPEEGWMFYCISLLFAQQLFPEWHFIQSLSYPSQLTPPHSPSALSRPTITAPDAEFIRLIYTARLRKYHHPVEHQLARTKLVEEFGLGDNPDVLFSFADALYAGFRWADCFAVTDRCLYLFRVLLYLTHHPQLEFCHW